MGRKRNSARHPKRCGMILEGITIVAMTGGTDIAATIGGMIVVGETGEAVR